MTLSTRRCGPRPIHRTDGSRLGRPDRGDNFDEFHAIPFEDLPGGKWRTFDARRKMPRVDRILIARGRAAVDIPRVNSFGPDVLEPFRA